MPAPHRPLTRRTALAAAPVAAVVAGCRWGPEEESPADPPAGSEGTVTRDDDTTYAAEALAAIGEVTALVADVADRFPGLATPLAGLTAMHLEHARLLEDAAEAPAPPTPLPVPAGSRQALALVRTRERRLQRRLADLADTVASGPFARALASMSAGVAQQVGALPATPEGAEP